MIADSADSGIANRTKGSRVIFYRYNSGFSLAWPVHGGKNKVNIGWVDGHVSSMVGQGKGETAAMSLYTDGKLTVFYSKNHYTLPDCYWDFK